MLKILLTGGSGLLGKEIQKHIECHAPTHDQMNILHPIFYNNYDLIIHAAAYTNVEDAEENPEKVFDINVKGTINLLLEYSLTPFVYISSEYAKKPVNMYGASKYSGELAVECLAEKYLIIRTLFKKRPWQFSSAWDDQWTQGDYVDVIAEKIVKEINQWMKNKSKSKKIYVGTERKTLYDLAKKTKPDVVPISFIQSQLKAKRPKDYL